MRNTLCKFIKYSNLWHINRSRGLAEAAAGACERRRTHKQHARSWFSRLRARSP